jgi:hypothetical protein
MKTAGFLIVLVLALAAIYFIWFAKTGEKAPLETTVDQYSKVRVELTRTNMQALQKIILSYMASEGEIPQSLQDVRNFSQPLVGATDAWGKSIKYERLSDSSFKLTSAGKDGVFGTADDIVLEY